MELNIKLYNNNNFYGYNQINQIKNYVPFVNNVEVINEYYENNNFVTECKVDYDGCDFEYELELAQLNDIKYEIDQGLIF